MKEHTKAVLSGSCAGAFGYTLTLPLDYIKQHMQNNVSFASILKNTSLRNYMSGGLIGISTITPQMAIKYSNNLIKYLTIKWGQHSVPV